MAVLADADRAAVWADLMRALGLTGLTKAQFRAAVDAVDQWVSDNAAAFNSAIPQPARAALTASQKAKLLEAVALKRFQAGV